MRLNIFLQPGIELQTKAPKVQNNKRRIVFETAHKFYSRNLLGLAFYV
jgi:hypothetical protein